jgi:phage terminase large subunit-like protein
VDLGEARVDLTKLDGLPAKDRERVEQLLGRLREQYERNPLELFEPHAKQTPFLGHVAHGTRSLFLGGNRSGKTTAGVVKDICQAVDREALPAHLQQFKFWDGPTRGRVVTPDFKQTHEVVLDKFKQWTPRDQMKGSGKNWWRNSYDAQARRLWFKNGSWIEFMSQEQEVDAFAAQNLHWVHFDEEPPYDRGRKQWDECMARLIDVDGSAWLTMTPLFGMSWVHNRYYAPFVNGAEIGDDGEDVLVTEVSSRENPHVSATGLSRFFKALGAVSKEELASREHGSFVAFEGMIYPNWSPQVHKIGPLAALPPAGAERARTMAWIDAGARFPALLLAYADDIGRVTVFDEVRPPQGTVIREVCALGRERLAAWGIKALDYSVIDPAALNRSDQTGRSARDEYARYGFRARPGDNAVSVGIGRVTALLERPGYLRVSSVCSKLTEEFLTYRWTSNKRAENAAREAPVKRDDHSLDALRYGVMSLPTPGTRVERPPERPSWQYDMPVDVGEEQQAALPGGAGAWV